MSNRIKSLNEEGYFISEMEVPSISEAITPTVTLEMVHKAADTLEASGWVLADIPYADMKILARAVLEAVFK